MWGRGEVLDLRAEFLHIPTSPENLPSTPLQLTPERWDPPERKPAQQPQQAFPPAGRCEELPAPERKEQRLQACSCSSFPGLDRWR
ncbi:hypothetical protein Y1Q_0004426 [Alligator mississippiensis]|uniref:Uncharacterized protein n=1 Tax=Alligator mississippiensis TaxID=8496 RepID=A0A151MWA1_ALLMI|nr:hypothetical protein Y1Q_0004426 [Alligator mississippiensis]